MPRSRRSLSRPGSRRSGSDRTRYSSGTPWEPKVGYSRAVRVGRQVFVSGTTATQPDGSIASPGDAYLQTVRTLENIETALEALGSRRGSIVRLRIFVTDMADFEGVARALGERFRPIRPACTLVEIGRLVDPAMRVEIEADAIDPVDRPSGKGRRSPAR
jgi:enamine deaminase RidA (YjgF/YER057c/UK114 family)